MKILFVCSGNICRSPTAEGLFRTLAADHGLDVEFDSAGTHGLHAGEAPDHRAVTQAGKNGLDLSMLRARQVTQEDFEECDIIYAMDRGHLESLKAKKPSGSKARLELYDPARDVPDPWYGDTRHFEDTWDIIHARALVLIEDIKRKLAS